MAAYRQSKGQSMTMFRITNAVLGLLAAAWWLLNRYSDMAEPIVAVVAATIVIAEIVGEVVAHRLNVQREAERANEESVLPDLLDRISREEGNIQQVIDGRRKQDKIIEEYPIELLAPHVLKLKQLKRFGKLAAALQAELERNSRLPSGSKEFGRLQKLLTEIKQKAAVSASNDTLKWVPWFFSCVLIIGGCIGLIAVRLPDDAKAPNPVPPPKVENADETIVPNPSTSEPGPN